MNPSWDRIQDARDVLRREIEPTPLVHAPSLSKNSRRVHLKIETGLPTGSFKVRGALFALHAAVARGPVNEVVAASTGNHGAAVAYAAKRVGIPAAIFLPKNPNEVKRARIAGLGARIVEVGSDISDALVEARSYVGRTGAFMLDDSTSADVPLGTAAIGCEIVEQLPNVSEVWVPMGDTALIRGVASAAKHLGPNIRVIGVQAETAPAYYLSWKKGEVVSTETCSTIADGLATRTPVLENVVDIREIVDEVHLVSDDQIIEAMRHLRDFENVLAEPAGAATTAAWIAHSGTERAEAVLLVSGGNIAKDLLERIGGGGG
jgi:threonine dehydratase